LFIHFPLSQPFDTIHGKDRLGVALGIAQIGRFSPRPAANASRVRKEGRPGAGARSAVTFAMAATALGIAWASHGPPTHVPCDTPARQRLN